MSDFTFTDMSDTSAGDAMCYNQYELLPLQNGGADMNMEYEYPTLQMDLERTDHCASSAYNWGEGVDCHTEWTDRFLYSYLPLGESAEAISYQQQYQHLDIPLFPDILVSGTTNYNPISSTQPSPPAKHRPPPELQPVPSIPSYAHAQIPSEEAMRKQHQLMSLRLKVPNETGEPKTAPNVLSSPTPRFHTVLHCPTPIPLDPSNGPLLYVNRNGLYNLTIQDVLWHVIQTHARSGGQNWDTIGDRKYKTVVKLHFTEDQRKKLKANPAFWSHEKSDTGCKSKGKVRGNKCGPVQNRSTDEFGFVNVLEYDVASAKKMTWNEAGAETKDTACKSKAGHQTTKGGVLIESALISQSFDQFEISWSTSFPCSSTSSLYGSADYNCLSSAEPIGVSIPIRLHFVSTFFSPVKGMKGVSIALSVTTSIVAPSYPLITAPLSTNNEHVTRSTPAKRTITTTTTLTTDTSDTFNIAPNVRKIEEVEREDQGERRYTETHWSHVRVFRERGAERKLSHDILGLKKKIKKLQNDLLSDVPSHHAKNHRHLRTQIRQQTSRSC